MGSIDGEEFLRVAQGRWLLRKEEAERCRNLCRRTGRSLPDVALELNVLQPFEVQLVLRLMQAGAPTRVQDDTETPTEETPSAVASPLKPRQQEEQSSDADPDAGQVSLAPARPAEETAPGEEELGDHRVGRYRIKRELGRGGMAIVYEAYDPVLKREVALKLLPSAGSGWERTLERFRREARAVAAMGQHPHIVQIHDFDRDGGRYYFTMDLVRGETLGSWLEESRSVREIVEVCYGVAQALAHAHAHGIVHRDLKPENVLMDEQQKPLVSDFGLAREVKGDSSVSVTGEMIGTPAYMSPEQARGRLGDIGPASDVYAFGVILYEALAGENPFRRTEFGETMLATIQHEAPGLRKRNPRVTQDVETIVAKCLEKEPGRRYADGAELSEELRRWLQGEPIRARRPSAWYLMQKWVSRHRAISALAGILVLLAVGAAVALNVVYRKGQEGVERAEEQRRRDVEGTELYKDAENALALGLMARRAGSLEPLEEAVRQVHHTAQKAFALDPHRTEALFVRGWAYLLEGRWQEAAEQLDRFVENWPGSPFGHYLRGRAYLGMYHETYEQALRDWSQLSARPDAGGSLLSFATIRRPAESDLEKLRPGMKALRERAREYFALLQAPSEAPSPVAPSLWKRPGLWETAQGLEALADQQHAEARDRFEKALAIRAEIDEAWEGLSQALCELWRGGTVSMEDVRAMLERGLEQNRGLESLYLLRAELDSESAASDFWQRGSEEAFELWESAERDAANAIDIWPHGAREYALRARVRRDRAEALASLGDEEAGRLLAAALQDGNEAVQRAPGNANAHKNRGVARIWLADWKANRGEDPAAEYGGAIEDFTQALRLKSDFSAARNNRASARSKLGNWMASRGSVPVSQYEGAIEDCEEVLGQHPDSPFARFNRANALLRWGDWKAGRGEDPVEQYRGAIEDFDQLLRQEPEDVLVHCNAGTARRRLGEWKSQRGEEPVKELEAAIRHYDQALVRNHNYVPALNNRGTAWLRLGEWEAGQGKDPGNRYAKAIEDCKKALRRNANSLQTYNLLGNVYSSLGDWKAKAGDDPLPQYREAIENYCEALQRNQDYASAYHNRGNARRRVGEWRARLGEDPSADFDAAIEDFSEALERNSESVESYDDRGRARLLLAEWRDRQGGDPTSGYRMAIADFEEALRRNRDWWKAYKSCGLAWLRLGEWRARREQDPTSAFQAAIQKFDSVLERIPDEAETYNRRGMARSNLGSWKMQQGGDWRQDFDAALRDFNQALNLEPELWQARANRGALYWKLGRLEEALADFEAAYRVTGDPALSDWVDRIRKALREGQE